jgi:hypothetical protein
LLQKWLKNAYDVEDNAYETLLFACSKKLDVLISTSFITKSDVKEESFPPNLKDLVAYSKEETTNMEDSISTTTPQFAIGSNKLNDPLMEPNSTQYVKKKMWQFI